MVADAKVLVVVPAFNAEPTLPETLAAILHSEVPLRVVVVDPESSDGTVQVAARFAEADPRVHLVSAPPGGPAATRNHGWRSGDEEFLLFCDADDVWRRGCLEALVAALDGDPRAVLATASFETVDLHGDIVDVSSYPRWVEEPMWPRGLSLVPAARLDFGAATARLCLPPPAGVLVRRAAFEQVGGFDESVRRSEDVFTWTKILQLGSGVHVPTARFAYRVHERQRSQSSGRALGAVRARVRTMRVARDRVALRRALHGGVATYATFARERLRAAVTNRSLRAAAAGVADLGVVATLLLAGLGAVMEPNAARRSRFAGAWRGR